MRVSNERKLILNADYRRITNSRLRGRTGEEMNSAPINLGEVKVDAQSGQILKVEKGATEEEDEGKAKVNPTLRPGREAALRPERNSAGGEGCPPAIEHLPQAATPAEYPCRGSGR